MALRNLLREPLRAFEPYVVGKPIDEVRREFKLEGRIAKLASNENPLGTSPLAAAAIRRAIDDASFYPDDNAWHLRQRLAARFGLDLRNVFPAAGSVEVIELCCAAYLEPGDSAVSSERTFAMYALAVAKAGAEFRAAPMKDGGYRYDLEAIAGLIDGTTKLVFLANPTNPTGTWFSAEEFDAFMSRVPEDVLVVYDSAYEEYWREGRKPDPVRWLKDGRRVLFLRTFSKAYGLAGLRIGYGIGPEEIIQGLMMVRCPFNANLLAQAGAIAALDDEEFVSRTREHTFAELEFLRKGLEGLPVAVPPTQTNFLFIDTGKKSSWLFIELQKVGVIVRPVGGRAIRVSTGLRQDNEKFLEHFRRLITAPDGAA